MRARVVVWSLVAALLVACQPELKSEQFAGTWQSSRVSTPLHMHANGEWEIRGDDGRVLQYGVWQLERRSIVWSIRMGDGRLMHEVNPVDSLEKRRFELREQDGSLTKFERRD
jgi:hypothetical protein